MGNNIFLRLFKFFSPRIAASATFALKAGYGSGEGVCSWYSPVLGVMSVSEAKSTYTTCLKKLSQL